MGGPLEQALGAAFTAAYLLTGNRAVAEAAVLAAVESWDTAESTSEILQRTLAAAAKSANPDMLPAPLPRELAAVLRLAPELRRPFVLRILAGLSRETSAAMLNLSAGQLDDRVCKAIETLALGKEKSKMEENNTTQQDIEQLAYRLWQERGEPMGSPEEDWLKAEEELRAVAAQA